MCQRLTLGARDGVRAECRPAKTQDTSAGLVGRPRHAAAIRGTVRPLQYEARASDETGTNRDRATRIREKRHTTADAVQACRFRQQGSTDAGAARR